MTPERVPFTPIPYRPSPIARILIGLAVGFFGGGIAGLIAAVIVRLIAEHGR